jgi:hypothetical protein
VVALALVAAVAHAQTTHADYVNQVNSICKRTAKQSRARLHHIRPTGNQLRDLIRKSSTYAKLLGLAARRIDAVEPPPADQPAVTSWIAGIRLEKRLVERFVRALKHFRFNRAKKLSIRSLRVRESTHRQANELGLTACGGGSSSG